MLNAILQRHNNAKIDNTTLEASQTTLQAAQTTLQEQVELSLGQFVSLTTKLNKQQSTLEFLQASMVSLIQKINIKEAASSSSRKHPRSATPTNTEDFVNQNTLNNLSLNTPSAKTSNMDTSETPQPDTYYNQEDDDNPDQDNQQRSR